MHRGNVAVQKGSRQGRLRLQRKTPPKGHSPAVSIPGRGLQAPARSLAVTDLGKTAAENLSGPTWL